MQICAINSGYWDTKVYNGRQYKFRTKLDNASENIINSANTFRINFDGQDYILGDGAERYNLDYDKTSNIIHKICTYYPLWKATDLRDEFKIMVALPLNLYTTLKTSYEDYLKTKDYISFTADGMKKYIRVAECKVFPEGPAALYANSPEKYKNDVVGFLDFGSLTVNGGIMHNLNLVRESIFTINAGTIILFNKLQKELNNRFLLNLRDYEIPGIITYGLKIKGAQKDVQELTRMVIMGHLADIITEMRKNNWNVDTLKILLTGGGSLLLEPYLRELLPGSLMGQDCVYDNVKGLYEIAKVVYA